MAEAGSVDGRDEAGSGGGGSSTTPPPPSFGQAWQSLLDAVRANNVQQIASLLDTNKQHLQEGKSACCQYLSALLDVSSSTTAPASHDDEEEGQEAKERGGGGDGVQADGHQMMEQAEVSPTSSGLHSIYTTLYNRHILTAVQHLPLLYAAYLGHPEALETLISRGGYNVNETVENVGVSAAHVAAIEGRTDCIMGVINRGANVELRDKHGRTPLFLAASCGQIDVTKCLINHDSDVNTIATGGLDTGRTPLHAACVGGYVDVVHLLINNGAKLNIRDAEGYTALHLAARDDKANIVRIIVKEGADVNVQDNAGKTALHISIPSKVMPSPEQLDIANFLSKTTKISLGDKNGVTVLHNAAYWNLASLIEDMIKYQSDVNLQDRSGKSPLHYAFMNKNKIGIDAAKVLISNKANIQASDRTSKMPLHELMKHDKVNTSEVTEFVRDWMSSHVPQEFGKSMLHLAVLSGHIDIVRFMLRCGVDVDVQDNSGNTALHLATIGARTDLIRSLISKGAMVNLQNFQQLSPLHYAVMLPRIVAAQMLLHHGANILMKDENGLTPLHRASGWGTFEMVKYLISQGAVVNEFQNKGQRPLHQAAEEGKVEIVEYLISKGSKVSIQDKDGNTPLHLAAKGGHSDVIRALTVNGAEVNLVDKDGQGPLHVACFFGKQESAQALINRGANVNLKDSQGLKPEQIAMEMGNYKVVSMMNVHRDSLVQYDPGALADQKSQESPTLSGDRNITESNDQNDRPPSGEQTVAPPTSGEQNETRQQTSAKTDNIKKSKLHKCCIIS